MGKIYANIKTIKELDYSRLNIPFYQRPYRWQTTHVETLLNCIKDNLCKEEYRMGSIILHENENKKLDIVDGQQRLTTLSLLFLCMDKKTPYKLNCEYRHLESKQNIYRNYNFIQKWVRQLDRKDYDTFQEFVLDNCSVVVITTDDLSEAFQMFDSQNGRGKELEAYNLLKAYHLRAIDNDTNQITITDEKKEIDRKWEESVLMKTCDSQEPLLKYIVNELYRIRQWTKNEKAWSFSKSKVKEFKGVQFNNGKSPLPLNNTSFLLYFYYSKFKEGTLTEGIAHRTQNGEQDINPFVSINMDIINGKMFFSYVQTYVSSYEYLFSTNFNESATLYQFKRDFNDYCIKYGGSYRTGDCYIREMYIALIIAMFDRFGENGVAKFYKTLYNLAYRKRLEQQSVFYKSIADYPISFFKTIATAVDETGLGALSTAALVDIECNKLGKCEEDIAQYIVCKTNTVIICQKDGLVINSKEFHIGDKITKSDFNNGKE